MNPTNNSYAPVHLTPQQLDNIRTGMMGSPAPQGADSSNGNNATPGGAATPGPTPAGSSNPPKP